MEQITDKANPIKVDEKKGKKYIICKLLKSERMSL